MPRCVVTWAAAAMALLGSLAPLASGQPPSCQIEWKTYTPATGPNQVVTGLAAVGGNLFVRGGFTSAGGVPANLVASFDGTTWVDRSQGYITNMFIPSPDGWAVAFDNLYEAGQVVVSVSPFQRAPGQYYNGTIWQPTPMVGLTNGQSTKLFPSGGVLYAYGQFSFPDASGVQAFTRSLAVFTGSRWYALGPQGGPPLNQGVASVVQHGGVVFATGSFSSLLNVQGQPDILARYAGKWVPSGWSEAGSGFNFPPYLIEFRDDLYAYGNFTAAGDGTPLNRFAKWNGATWVQVAGGFTDYPFHAFVGDDGHGQALYFYADGAALNTAPGYAPMVTTNGMVRFDGVGFTAMPAIGSSPNATASIDNGHASAIYVGFSNRTLGTGGPGNLARLGPLESLDTDGDGLLDHWETAGQGLDVDCDGTPDLLLHEMGATPDHKDIFVEVDVMTGMLPDPSCLDMVVEAFRNAPAALVNNPDGQPGIRLHILLDETDLPVESFPQKVVDFQRAKAAHFGTAADRIPAARSLLDAKRKVFRYAIFARDFGADTASGLSEIPGDDIMVALGDPNVHQDLTTEDYAGTFMHELGHSLGLGHGGDQIVDGHDEVYNYKPNYHSVMNYAWQLPNRLGWVLDYSRETLPVLVESALDENAGIGGNPLAEAIIGPAPVLLVAEAGAIDYNENDDFDASPVARDINHVDPGTPPSPNGTLRGYTDWPALKYNFRSTSGYGYGAAPRTNDGAEMTAATREYLRSLTPPRCPADLDNDANFDNGGTRDGAVTVDDLLFFLAAFEAGSLAADLDDDGANPAHSDGAVTVDDLLFLLVHFEAGC